MRLGVLDIGSNTIHLLIADIHAGGRPIAATSERAVVRLMRYLGTDGAIASEGVTAILDAVREARRVLDAEAPDDFIATATSAIREAPNGPAVIAMVEEALGRPLRVLSGTQEADLTFLAARRWFGWSAGQLLMLDIGGGSLELAAGSEELPDISRSLPLGAGRMTVEFLPQDPPGEEAVGALRAHVRTALAPVVSEFATQLSPDHVVGSSKTIRSLARLAGDQHPGWAGSDRVTLSRSALGSWIPRLARLPADSRQILPGITADRTMQIVAGAVVLHETMDALGVTELEASPWALREGLLLRYIETVRD
ncbi:Ppx/GppA phosphatase family protein [Microbacterium gorillae]|uniref:Ppx/GppA phosphatase family protein n=1 Tax=Microbacterium gorillae TaxID=1231063 RepID=UPI00058F4190|nr:Ppx/GppA phosphatase family protein [Microbacterium gorillae]